MPSLEQDQLRQWALRGAKQRLLDIAEEVAAIHRTFPRLRRRGNGIPAASVGQSATASTAIGRPARGRRRVSAAARRRISEAQKARWAKQKANGSASDAAAKAAPQAKAAKGARRRGGARKMSAAARKRISDAQKARWAALKAKRAK
jgi:hypothetical protein